MNTDADDYMITDRYLQRMMETVFNGEMAEEAAPYGTVSASCMGEEFYVDSARRIFRRRPLKNIKDEYRFLRKQLGDKVKSKRGSGTQTGKRKDGESGLDVFGMLQYFAENVLNSSFSACSYKVTDIRFNQNKSKLWTDVYQKVGQDTVICAYIADRVCRNGGDPSYLQRFDWPAVIFSDDEQLNAIIERGLAENHAHLEATTQIFPLTWACMMNYPVEVCRDLGDNGFVALNKVCDVNSCAGDSAGEHVREKYDLWIKSLNPYINRKEENFNTTTVTDIVEERYRKIKTAAIIRVLLFRKIIFPDIDVRGEYEKYKANPYNNENWFLIESARKYGTVGKRRNRAGTLEHQYKTAEWLSKSCAIEKHDLNTLDYAISSMLYDVDASAPGRLSEGERSFLYHCFVNIFMETWGKYEKDMFYSYILLKTDIRKRYIHNDMRMGFDNFQEIQRRKKEILYSKMEIYNEEQYRLSIVGNLNENRVKSLETRIMAEKYEERISFIDAQVNKAVAAGVSYIYENWIVGNLFLTENGRRLRYQRENKFGENADRSRLTPNYFFTAHIARCKDNDNQIREKHLMRNNKVRTRARKAVISLGNYLDKTAKPAGMRELYGGSQRIFGLDVCSSEQGCRPDVFGTDFRYARKAYGDKCGFTYHVGEEFESIVDGLRAIDEAVRYLELQKGDRLGHALALGMDPEKSVSNMMAAEQSCMYMTQQDLLDDLIWLFFRTQEYGIRVKGQLQNEVKEEAVRLLRKLYIDKGVLDWEKHEEGWLEKYYHSWKLRGDHPSFYKSGMFAPVKEIKNPTYYEESKTAVSTKEDLDAYRMDVDTVHLYFKYHYDAQTKTEGQEEIPVELSRFTEEFYDCIRNLQAAMRREIAEREIFIECNPTSNLRIGGMKSYSEHPIDTFNGVNAEMGGEIKVSINTDNMGIFDISLPHEYRMIKDGLLERGYSESEIGSYLEKVRGMGFAMAFYR